MYQNISPKTLIHILNFFFDAGDYNFGYQVGPNGQFHHETRGPDGVTYGCYGYIDPDGKLRVTHYVADSQGYRVVEPKKPVEIFAVTGNERSLETNDQTNKFGQHKGQTIQWTDLFFPKGCGMFEGGVRPDVIVKPLPGGGFAPVR